MPIFAKKLSLFFRRPVCAEICLARFLVTAALLHALLAWSIPALERASAVMQLSSVHFVMASQLHAAQSEARRQHVQLRFCRSDDALTCAPSGGWEQGWLAFEDRNHNGLHDRDEPIVHVGSALPAAFVLQGDLNAGRVNLCLRDAVRPGCQPEQLALAVFSGESRPRRS